MYHEGEHCSIDQNPLLIKMVYHKVKVFSEGPMVDMALQNISSCTVSSTALPVKSDLHFQPTMS